MSRDRKAVLTAFGVIAAATMVVSYALEERHRYWTAAFAVGCAATAVYGVLTSAWIFFADWVTSLYPWHDVVRR